MELSKKYQLNDFDWQRLYYNFMKFASPIVVMYLSSVSAIISMPDHVFSPNDFIPNTIILGMIIKQLVDTGIDIFSKWSDGTH